MFEAIRNFIKKVVSKLVGKENISEALNVESSVSNKMKEGVKLWALMFEDKAPWVGKNTKSMNLSSGIASELARLTTLEFKSEIVGSKRADFLNESYQKLIRNIRTATEYACAKGGLVFKPYVVNNDIFIEIIQGDRVFPVDFINGEMVSCVFVDKFVVNDTVYCRLEFHKWGDDYTVINKAYKSSDKREMLGVEIPLNSVEKWKDIEEKVSFENISRPFFSYFKMPFANTIDSDSDIGVSVYSRAVNLIKEADEQYSRILWEYEGSELAIDADATALKISSNVVELPKRDERLFRKIDLQGRNGDFYSVFSPNIRDSSLFNGLNKILQRIEFVCGLAYGTISDVNETAKTATEIISSKQRSYATVSDVQKSLQRSLENLIISMNELCSLYNIAPDGEYEVSFEFDDSLIVDSGTDQAIMLQEVQAGIIRPEIYLMRRYGLTEEQCKEYMPNMDIDEEIDKDEE